MGMSRSDESVRLDEQIVKYYEDGWKIQRIAEELNLTVAAVKKRISRIREKDGLVKRNNIGTIGKFTRISDDDLQKCVDDGLSPEEIAEKFNLTIGIVNLKLNRIRGDK